MIKNRTADTDSAFFWNYLYLLYFEIIPSIHFLKSRTLFAPQNDLYARRNHGTPLHR